MATAIQSLAASRSSSTDSTETVKPNQALRPDFEGDRGRFRPVVARRESSSERSRERTIEDSSKFDAATRRSARPSSTSSSRSSSRNAPHSLRPLSPTSSSRPCSSSASHSRSSSKIPRRPRSSQTSTQEIPLSNPVPSSNSRRPSLTLSTKLVERLSTCGGTSSLPSPAPSPSRLCPALPLPLLSANEASIQVSSVVVEGELDASTVNVANEENNIVNGSSAATGVVNVGGGAKEMLETLRDKGTLIDQSENSNDVQIPGLSQPFVLPALERNPRLPPNLFDCTNTISLPDLPPTGDDSEDEVMNMLPSPISPTFSSPPPNSSAPGGAELYRARSRSNTGNRYSTSGGGAVTTFSQPSSRKVSFSIDHQSSMNPSSSPLPHMRSDRESLSRRSSTTPGSSILKPVSSGKRRQLAGLGTTRTQELLEACPSRRRSINDDNDIEQADSEESSRSDRIIKKRPALISFTSFEEEFGLKPPRLDADYDRQHFGVPDCGDVEGRNAEDSEVEGKEEGARKERKWWHLG